MQLGDNYSPEEKSLKGTKKGPLFFKKGTKNFKIFTKEEHPAGTERRKIRVFHRGSATGGDKFLQEQWHIVLENNRLLFSIVILAILQGGIRGGAYGQKIVTMDITFQKTALLGKNTQIPSNIRNLRFF